MFANLQILRGVLARSPLSFGVSDKDGYLYEQAQSYLTALRDDPAFGKRLDNWWHSRAWEEDHDWL